MMQCPKCGQDDEYMVVCQTVLEGCKPEDDDTWLCLNCGIRFIPWQQSQIASLTAELAETKAKAEKYRKGLEEAKGSLASSEFGDLLDRISGAYRFITKALEE